MSLLGAVVRKIDPKTVINYFRRNLIGSGQLGRKEINKIKGDLKNLSQEDRERLRTADLEDLTPAEVDLVMFGFVGFKDFGMPNKTIVQMKGNEFTTFKNKLNKIVDDVRAGKTVSVEEFNLRDGKITSDMVEKQKELPKGEATQLTLFNEGGEASMLKPDFIDIDGDGNKTESMKTAAKQAKERDGMAHGGGPLPNKGLEELHKEEPDVVAKMLREQKQEGGNMDMQMSMLMDKPEPEQEMSPETPMESDEEMEDNYIDFILDEALSEEEEDMLMSKLKQDEQLSMLFDKVIEVASEFAGSGPVEGPGSGVSDSIPARLSDGEFVFTAKATEQIGADELMRMMKDAEAAADRQGMQEGGMMMEEEEVDQFGKPIDSDIARDELKKNMMSVNPRYR